MATDSLMTASPDMSVSVPGPLHPLVESWKTLASGARWSEPSRIDGKMEFLAPLDIDGVTIAELSLRGIVWDQRPDQDVMLQLETGIPGARTRTPLIRLDWKPLSPIHRNLKGPIGLRGMIILGTHEHPFEPDWLEDMQRMRIGNLPIAQQISVPLQTFSDVLNYGKNLFRVSDIESISMPPWSPKLL